MSLPRNVFRVFLSAHFVYNLKDSEGKLTLPKPSINYLKIGFSYREAMLWNTLPKSLKNAVSGNHFKQIVRKVADISVFHNFNHIKQL